MLRPSTEDSPDPLPAGETVTLRSLFECQETRLLRYAYTLTGRREVAEEIVQDVFLQLHAQWESVTAPEAWLYRSVRNRSFDFLRRSKRETLHAETELLHDAGTNQRSRNVDGTMRTSSLDDPPETTLIKDEASAVLRQALSEMKESDQELIRLKYFEGLKYRDISQRTGLSVSNVGFRLHYLLKTLADRLPTLGVENP